VAAVLLVTGQLGVVVVEVTEVVDDWDETETAAEVDEDGGTVLTVVELVDLLLPATAMYAPTIIMSITITTTPIIAPLARALCWPYFLLGMLVRIITLHERNQGFYTTNIYFENRIRFLYISI
jgi:hypothetical protein